MNTYSLLTVKVTLSLSEPPGESILKPAEAEKLLRVIYADLDADQEHVVLLALDAGKRPLGYKVVSSGGVDASIVVPRPVFRAALHLGAAAIILAHNHPSGDPRPSPEDVLVTRRMKDAAAVLGVEFCDHLVLGHPGRMFSFAEEGLT